jgi:transformation/transcription domain-associated protein
LQGIFDGIHVEEVKDLAVAFIRKLSTHILDAESRRNLTNEIGLRRQPSLLLSVYFDAVTSALARDDADEAKRSVEEISAILGEFASTRSQNGISLPNVSLTFYHVGCSFKALCAEDTWVQKIAGCAGINIMTSIPELGLKWVMEYEVDLVRTLFHILKDLPFDLPRDVDDVVNVLTRVLRVSNGDLARLDPTNLRTKLSHLLSIFCIELSSAHFVVRQAAQTCIDLLAEMSGKSASELLAPHRERTLAQIYNKPLRALPFPIQIGMVEAVRYCLSLDPPLAELNDELLRLLHETMGLLEPDDSTGFARGNNPRQNAADIIKLRVACIKLLTASMPITDFFVKQVQTRTRYEGTLYLHG